MKLLTHHANRQRNRGFTLPAVLIISMALMIVGLSFIQNSSSIYDSLNDQYYNRLAQEAAEAGVAYVNFCLSANYFVQTWGPANSRPNLTQSTDCNGNDITSAPDYVMENGSLRTSFSVGDLDTRSDGAIIFSVNGQVQNVTSGGTITRSYGNVRNEVVKWKEFNPTVSSSGTSKTCAVITGELYCWGKNSNSSENFSGNLGNGTTTDSLVPVKVQQDAGVLAGKTVSKVTSAQFHSCALADGTVYCWGRNFTGQLGDETTTDRTVPVKVGGALESLTVTDISTTGNVSCAIANSKIYCWGSNVYGTVGNNSTVNVSTPTLVNTSQLGSSYVATKLSTSGSRSFNMCAIADGKAWCWGNNEAGQVGNDDSGTTRVRVPTKVDDTGVLAGKTVTSISQDGYYNGNTSYTHVCAVASGQAYCWGDNVYGQLGRGPSNTTASDTPVAVYTSGVLNGKTISDIVVGLQHSCALTDDGKVYCWGANGAGQIGDGLTGTRYVPTAVSTSGGLNGKTVVTIGGGANRGCAITNSFQSFCWGLNTDGQLGDGTQTNRNVPTEAIFLRPKAPTYIF
ncbi:MAG: hypothetical protein WBP12_03085 [Candidatus Saccharimonas sp.]